MDFEVNIRCCENDDDIDILKKMTSKEGWSTSDVDCKAILKVDRNGLLVAEDKFGTPVGFIGVSNMMSPGMTFVGPFIVREDLRGKGIGKKLWRAMLNATKENTIAVIDSVPEMKNWYKEHGFQNEAFCLKLCKGTLATKEHMANKNPCTVELLLDNTWPELVEYDRQIFGYTREDVLRAWLWATGSYSIVAVRNNRVVGYANLHWKSEKECNIRMMYCDNQDVADALLENLLQNIPLGSEVFFDMLAERPFPKCFSDFKCVTTEHRLYSKEMPGIQTNKIYFSSTHMI